MHFSLSRDAFFRLIILFPNTKTQACTCIQTQVLSTQILIVLVALSLVRARLAVPRVRLPMLSGESTQGSSSQKPKSKGLTMEMKKMREMVVRTTFE